DLIIGDLHITDLIVIEIDLVEIIFRNVFLAGLIVLLLVEDNECNTSTNECQSDTTNDQSGGQDFTFANPITDGSELGDIRRTESHTQNAVLSTDGFIDSFLLGLLTKDTVHRQTQFISTHSRILVESVDDL